MPLEGRTSAGVPALQLANRIQFVQRSDEGVVGVCAGKCAPDVREGLVGGETAGEHGVHGCNGGGAGLRLDAVQQHGATLGAQLGDGGGGLVQYVGEVRVGAGVVAVDQPHLDVVAGRDPGSWDLIGAEPA
jgi:hypothetical protein